MHGILFVCKQLHSTVTLHNFWSETVSSQSVNQKASFLFEAVHVFRSESMSVSYKIRPLRNVFSIMFMSQLLRFRFHLGAYITGRGVEIPFLRPLSHVELCSKNLISVPSRLIFIQPIAWGTRSCVMKERYENPPPPRVCVSTREMKRMNSVLLTKCLRFKRVCQIIQIPSCLYHTGTLQSWRRSGSLSDLI
jgi:hypothetical protein